MIDSSGPAPPPAGLPTSRDTSAIGEATRAEMKTIMASEGYARKDPATMAKVDALYKGAYPDSKPVTVSDGGVKVVGDKAQVSDAPADVAADMADIARYNAANKAGLDAWAEGVKKGGEDPVKVVADLDAFALKEIAGGDRRLLEDLTLGIWTTGNPAKIQEGLHKLMREVNAARASRGKS